MVFLKGADVSSLQAMEDNGALFYDIDGNRDEALNILKNNGINSIRLRIFNNPTLSFDRGDYCNVENTIQIARKVKRHNMELFLDFHYSDFWADWQKQNVPKDWAYMTSEELIQAVYDFTLESLLSFKEHDAWPDMVQIGNEIGYGMLWNHGHLNNPELLVKLLNAGISATKAASDSTHKIPKTMIHIECGGDLGRTDAFFQTIHENGIDDFDYIGLSYYPYWAGDYDAMLANCRNVNEKFGKQIVLVETAFPYTDDSHDDMPNVVTGELTYEKMGLEPSEENQYEVLHKLLSITQKEACIEGVYYWEPTWYQLEGVGVEKAKGNEWENQALFDNNGHALKALTAFQ